LSRISGNTANWEFFSKGAPPSQSADLENKNIKVKIPDKIKNFGTIFF
jgi:hypothetical protein